MESRRSLRHLTSLLIRLFLSLACAGITYFVWMGLFILLGHSIGSLGKGILWFAAPIATAMGFALGIFLHEQATGARKVGFSSVLAWPLLGCVVGAVAIYWQGPMLIVFGMFAVGTATVAVREVVLHCKESRNQENA